MTIFGVGLSLDGLIGAMALPHQYARYDCRFREQGSLKQ